jgi:hypothetical protein
MLLKICGCRVDLEQSEILESKVGLSPQAQKECVRCTEETAIVMMDDDVYFAHIKVGSI